SAAGGARMLLRLGEVRAVQLLVSPQVLDELEGAVRRKAPHTLGLLALLLERSGLQVVPSPTADSVRQVQALVHHLGDAQFLAAAWDSEADYFVTMDQRHFLGNADLKGRAPFMIGTPGDFIAWYRSQFAIQK
ncbi:MAG: PIN domain-containing protein, partial [Chloroflexi bacterium]|nr:PIN domain-containing protein [Chloroflexota bacterium]